MHQHTHPSIGGPCLYQRTPNQQRRSTKLPLIYCETALLPDGWCPHVRIEYDNIGMITSVLPNQTPQPGDQLAQDGVTLPALADLHSHAFQRAMSGLTERASGHGKENFWTWRDMMFRFVGLLDPDQMGAIAAMAFMEMLEGGFAAVAEFHYLHNRPDGGRYDQQAEMALQIVAAANLVGIGLTLLPVLYMHSDAKGGALQGGQCRFRCHPEDYQRIAEAVTPSLQRGDDRLGIAPHSLRAVSLPALSVAPSLTAGPVHIHAAEQTGEVEEIQATHGQRPIELLLDRMAIDDRWCLIHSTHTSPDEIVALAKSGAVAGLCPITEANLGDGVFRGPDFLAAGGRLGIGSDANTRLSVAGELCMLEYAQRLAHRQRCVFAEPGQSVGMSLYRAALAGGAQALGRKSGAIAVGNWCDLVTCEASLPELAGLRHDALIDGWLFGTGDRAVRNVWSAGRSVVSAGRHLARDAISARYRQVMNEIMPSLS